MLKIFMTKHNGALLVLALCVATMLILYSRDATSGTRYLEATHETEKHTFRIAILAEGLEHPWSLAFLPDDRMLVTERPGGLRIIENGVLSERNIAGLPAVAERGQGGLMDVAVHPLFEKNRWIYLSYTAKDRSGYGTEVVRGELNGYSLDNVKSIFRALPKSAGGRHFGSRILFDPEGYLYITLGERGDRPRAQDLGDHAGSIIRLRDDGGIPDDNPFVTTRGAKPEIYTYGNRNVQGAALHPKTGVIWTHEHGPQGGDEVNIIKAGTNYGWPVITYGRNYGIGTKIGEGTAKTDMAQPTYYWDPSIAPSGMAFYDGDKFPEWQGDLFVGALKYALLVRLELENDKVIHEERMLTNVLGRIRDVRSGPDGYLYVLTDEANGVLARLEPAKR
jgi:glucose/arabinose dehydrogenase